MDAIQNQLCKIAPIHNIRSPVIIIIIIVVIIIIIIVIIIIIITIKGLIRDLLVKVYIVTSYFLCTLSMGKHLHLTTQLVLRLQRMSWTQKTSCTSEQSFGCKTFWVGLRKACVD